MLGLSSYCDTREASLLPRVYSSRSAACCFASHYTLDSILSICRLDRQASVAPSVFSVQGRGQGGLNMIRRHSATVSCPGQAALWSQVVPVQSVRTVRTVLRTTSPKK